MLVDDNYHYMQEEHRYIAGRFATYQEALEVAKEIVDEFFKDAKPNASAEELYRSYVMFGEDPWIAAFGAAPAIAPRFSAWTYAAALSRAIADQQSESAMGESGRH